MKPAQVFTMHLIAAYAYSTRAGVIFWGSLSFRVERDI
jgi:hypothetical protein